MNDTHLRQQLNAVLGLIEQISKQGAVYHGLHERVLLQNRSVSAFCHLCLEHPVTAPFCRFSCCDATLNALSSGEPHYYRCWAGLLFVTVPIAPGNRCCGGISLGGFYAEGEKEDIRSTLRERLGPWTRVALEPFFARLGSLREITPGSLHGLGFLVMETTFSNGLNSSDFFRAQNEKYRQQRRIAEAYGDIRQAVPSTPDILADTTHLVALLHRRDEEGAIEFVSRYLARLLMVSNWDLTKLKAHLRVLLAVLTSQDLLRDVPWAAATSRELRRMSRLEHGETTEAACYEVSAWIREWFHARERDGEEGRSLGDRLQQWLLAHYQERVTLSLAARATGASTSTLVHRLRAETGRTFKDLLRGTRIAEAKKLLATTSLEIADIADRCGFSDQSHFTREFKRTINLTPGLFRTLLRVPEQALRTPGAHSLDDPATPARAAPRQAAPPPGRRPAQKKRRGVTAPSRPRS
jgi:AraC-like DNA-binding protein